MSDVTGRAGMEELGERLGRQWQHLTGLGEPAPGSELAADDRVNPFYSLSAIAQFALMVSVDNLSLRVQAVGSQSLHPIAVDSPMRTALLAASKAVWLLAPPDSNTRIRRAMRLAYQDAVKHRSYLRDLDEGDLTPELDRWRAGELARLAGNIDEIIKAAADRKLAVEHSQITETAIIERAAEMVFVDDPARHRRVLELWRELSATAHAYRWSLLDDLGVDLPARGPARLRIERDLDADMADIRLVAAVNGAGLALLELRGTVRVAVPHAR